MNENKKNIYTVEEVNTIIRKILINHKNLNRISIKGELNNFKAASSGHYYFNLKDSESASIISIIMWRSTVASLSKELFLQLEEGKEVVVTGGVELYTKGGRYSLIVNKIELVGEGNLWEKFIKLKNTLKEKGLFDTKYKKPISRFNYNIALITSKTGAVVHDFKTTIDRRFPFVTINLFSCAVQGENAHKTIIHQLEKADSMNFDVIVLARGGGSIEDLWSFNEEELAIAIFKARTPIVSAIGHESDVSISDLVSDLRAPTPTAAAELIIPDLNELKDNIKFLYQDLNSKLKTNINDKKFELMETMKGFDKILASFGDSYRQKINSLNLHLQNNMKNNIIFYKNLIEKLNNRLNDLSPTEILKRGYAIPYIKNKAISSIKVANINDEIDLILKDGEIKTIIKEISKKEINNE